MIWLSFARAFRGFLDYLFSELLRQVTNVKFVPHFLTQDRLERDFSMLCRSAVGGGNPTIYCAAYTLKRLRTTAFVGQQTSPDDMSQISLKFPP